MILVDSSAWVEFDRATDSRVDRRIAELIEMDGPIATTEPVIMEILAGARDDQREAQLRRLLFRFTLLQIDPVVDFEGAARVHRRCRRGGLTPRGLLDCMIIAVALRNGASLLACDRDMSSVAGFVGLTLDVGSSR